jgi:hypothetical protein
VQAWVAAWQAAPTPGVVRDDYAALNLGQLKAVAQPFYDRLIEKGYATKYPWTDSASPKDDYALLNIGQLKNLFSMDLSELINNEGDQNSLPDAWQLRYFGQTGVDPNADPNRNGVSNWHEYLEGTDPTLDYYQGVTPVLIAIQGNRQASLPGKFLALPWKVLVRRPDGSPWIGAPVRFTAAAEEGLLAPEPTETAQLSSALTVISDSEGYAQVWLKCP